MKRISVLSAVAAITCAGIVVGASAGAATEKTAHRGAVVSATRVQHLSAKQVSAALDEDQYDSSHVRFGVDAYRIVYRTVDVHGRPTRASGLLALPRNDRSRLGTVNFTHGTMATKAYGPSVDDGGKSLEALTFSADGYAAVVPDYLGLGRGPGRHPFMHVRSEVSASLDMLTAARTVAADHDRVLDNRILITGFSQGGDVAMALGRAIQRGAAPGLTVRAIAPVSGPYDLMHAELPASLDGRLAPENAVYYLGFALTAWNRIYHFYDTPSEAFRAPYDHTIEKLYDGYHSNEQIVRGLPSTLPKLLTPRFLKLIGNPSGPFRTAVTDNDGVCTWSPHAPVRLFGARNDDHVAIANSQLCQESLAARGVQAPLVDVGPVGHLESSVRALPLILQWFDDSVD